MLNSLDNPNASHLTIDAAPRTDPVRERPPSPSLRSRVRNATLLVLGMVLLMGAYEVPRIWELGGAVRAVLQRNYVSILAGRHMQMSLHRLQVAELQGDAHPVLGEARADFTYWMDVESQDLTEVGEPELAHDLNNHGRRLFATVATSPKGSRHDKLFDYLQDHLTDLVEMNQNAMYRDDARAQQLAFHLMITFGAGLLIASLLGVTLSWTLGSAIARPLSELAQRLHGVAEGKTQVRLGPQKLSELNTVAGEFNQMAERLEYYDQMNVERLVLEKRKTEAIIESLEDGLILIDSTGLVAHINEVASIIIGVERNDATGKRFDNLGSIHPHYVRVRDALLALEADSSGHRVEIELHIRGRAHSYVLKSIGLLQHDNPIGTLLILQDVTYMRDQDRARVNLFATLSHELRTPLTSMVIATQTMERQKSGLTSSMRELVDMTVEETTRMIQLADNLLNLARGNIPSIPTEREKIEMAKLIAEIGKRFVIQAQEKNISLETLVEGTPMVNADRVKLSWVILNLIGNALRYTPPAGKIVVGVRATENNLVILEVSDTGPGIPPAIRDHVFERFAQYSTPGYEPGAAGLGLSIVKDIVEAHGGRISIENVNGNGGTRFVVQLPALKEG
jgi:two-component system, NtrC family, sensor histidine kinase KinB